MIVFGKRLIIGKIKQLQLERLNYFKQLLLNHFYFAALDDEKTGDFF